MARGTAVDIGAEALCSVQLRPSQLTVLSDGVTLGFELPGASSGPTSWRTHPMSGSGGRCAVPAVQIGVQALCSWRQDDARFRVQYAAGALMAYDVGGVTCTPHLVRRSLEGPMPARAATSRWERMVLSASARASTRPFEAPDKPHLHNSSHNSKLNTASAHHHDEVRPQLTRWGCSTKLVFVWACNVVTLLAGWSLLLLLTLVAVPRSGEDRGLSEEAVWRQARAALAFGLLNLLLIIDFAKVVVIVGTGPGVISLLVRIRSPRVRLVVRKVLESIYLPVALVCP